MRTANLYKKNNTRKDIASTALRVLIKKRKVPTNFKFTTDDVVRAANRLPKIEPDFYLPGNNNGPAVYSKENAKRIVDRMVTKAMKVLAKHDQSYLEPCCMVSEDVKVPEPISPVDEIAHLLHERASIEARIYDLLIYSFHNSSEVD